MSEQYLVIQNRGVAPIEAFTLLGASMSRAEDNLIGQFGSGAKLAITTLLRKGHEVTVYCGLTCMQFKTKEIVIEDGVSTKTEQQVYIQFAGTSRRKQDLGWVLGYGELDWVNEDMAIREFVANAIDHTVKNGQNINDAFIDRDLAVEIVDEQYRGAKTGYTRIFISSNEACERYVEELPKRFLHFSGGDLGKTIMPKANRNVTPGSRKAMIYVGGVFVAEFTNGEDALCDYNLPADSIKIDESRNLNAFYLRAAIAERYQDAGIDDLARIFRALDSDQVTLEGGLDPYYLSPSSWSGASDKQLQTWQAAWTMVHGNKVACKDTDKVVGEFARRKGHTLAILNESSWLEAIQKYGIKTAGDMLDINEKSGRTVTAPTFEAIDAVREVWGWVEATDLMPEDTAMPTIKGFDEIMDGESETLGFYEDDTVYIRNDLGGQMLLETALEEVAHYITNAADNSRDFQTFFMRLLVRWLAK